MTLNDKKVLSILKYVNDSEYGYLNLEDGDFELTAIKKDMDLSEIKDIIHNNGASNVQVSSPPVKPQENKQEIVEESIVPVVEKPKVEVKEEKNVYTVKAPMVGTFFSRPSPEEDEYVKIGDVVDNGHTVCLIEVMKLFNSVPAGVNGKIEKILVSDGELVEYNQPLFLIKVDSNQEISK